MDGWVLLKTRRYFNEAKHMSRFFFSRPLQNRAWNSQPLCLYAHICAAVTQRERLDPLRRFCFSCLDPVWLQPERNLTDRNAPVSGVIPLGPSSERAQTCVRVAGSDLAVGGFRKCTCFTHRSEETLGRSLGLLLLLLN